MYLLKECFLLRRYTLESTTEEEQTVSARSARLLALAVAGAAGMIVRALYGRLGRFEISEASMSPTLLAGDYVLTDRSLRPPYRGDIVVFEHPERPSFFLVKRVVGLPGERLTIDSGRVLVNGTPLSEPWTSEDTGPDGVWELGEDEAFVLGDSRWLSSGDSREIGPLPAHRLTMKIVFRYWPLDRLGPVR
jgi:signal peptidase I